MQQASLMTQHHRASFGLLLAAAGLAAASSPAWPQPPATAPQGAVSARDSAPIDLTGHWVALITDDWVYRMITPAKGDYSYVPLNAEGRRVADTWDATRDAAEGRECKGYAAPAIMRLPSRVEISWQDDNTLELDIDTGMQTRLFHFGEREAQGPRTLQGWSYAEWEISGNIDRQLVFGGARTSLDEIPRSGSLRVDTNHLEAGYLRRNGVPFSENAFMTEYFNLLVEDDGNQYLVIQTFVEDPQYLARHFVRTLQFKREPDGSKRSPMDCATANKLSQTANGLPSPDGGRR
jgi:hypothetical protein